MGDDSRPGGRLAPAESVEVGEQPVQAGIQSAEAVEEILLRPPRGLQPSPLQAVLDERGAVQPQPVDVERAGV